jgi:hypothetical protein
LRTNCAKHDRGSLLTLAKNEIKHSPAQMAKRVDSDPRILWYIRIGHSGIFGSILARYRQSGVGKLTAIAASDIRIIFGYIMDSICFV